MEGPKRTGTTQTNINEQLKAGVIEDVSRECASPMVFCTQIDEKQRFCVHYCHPKTATIPNRYQWNKRDAFLNRLKDVFLQHTAVVKDIMEFNLDCKAH